MDSNHAAAAAAAELRAPVPGPVRTSIPAAGRGRRIRAVQLVPMLAMVAQVLLIAAVAAVLARRGVALSAPGWAVGVACAVATNALLARGLAYYGAERLGPADWVTLARSTLAVGVAAL